MKYYIGKIDQDMLDALESPYQYQGESYEYCIEYGSNPGGLEDLVIKDCVGRSVPVSVQNIPELVQVLNNIYTNSKILEASLALEADIENPRFIVV